MPESTHGPDADGTQPVPQSYSYPTAGTPATGTEGVALADDPNAPTTPGRKRTGLLVGGLAALVVLGGGGVFAATQLSGGGAQPADVLPGDAYAYVRLDIDPSAGQKVAAVRFLGKLPQVKDTLGSDDPRRKVWELITKDAKSDCVSKLTYDADIEPWLGDRAGLALRPGGTEDKPNLAVAVQVKDEGKAKDAFSKLLACGGDDGEVVTRDGYALLMPKGTSAAMTAAIDKGTLAENATFKSDMSDLGEQGIASMWFDMGTGLKDIAKMSGSSADALAAGTDAKGRIASAVRFDSSYVEVAGILRGGPTGAPTDADAAQLLNLPDDTAVALQVSGADEALGKNWPQLKKQLDTMAGSSGEDPVAMLEQQLGLSLPKDLQSLLGRSFTLALPDQKFGSDVPAVGAKVVSSDAKRAEEVINKIEAMAGGGDVVRTQVDGDTLYAASTPDYAAKLKAGGSLGDSDTFKTAMGDVSKATVAVFVDLDKLEKNYLGQMDGEGKAFAESLRAVGLSGQVTGDGEGSFALRLVGN